MNEYEMQRVIRFLKRTRQPFLTLVPAAEPDATWNIITHLIESEITGAPVTLSTLVSVSEVPYATGLRRIHRMIDDGVILKRSRSKTGKTFTLHPSPALKAQFDDYARQMKSLLAETFGRAAASEDENDYYFGGISERVPIGLPAGEDHGLRFLLHDDNYFASMRNMWVDFRSNRASRRDFEMCVLPDLHARLVANAAAPVSEFDVVTINVPWLAEFAARGALCPIDRFSRPDDIQRQDFHPVVWSTGMWQQRQYGVPIYVTIEVLAARRDLFDGVGLSPPRTFDEVIAAGRALHAPAKERVGIVWNAARGMPLAHSFMFFLGCCGSGVFEHARTAAPEAAHLGRVQIDSRAGLEVLDYMHRLIEISPPDILDMEWKRGLDLFMHGGSAMSYVWTMRAARFEYDIHSAVKRKVRYLPHPAGPGGTNLSPMGGFLLAVPANLPEHRARRAHEAIASMASPDAMRVHAKNGFPVVPRFSVAADPEAAAGSPLIGVVDSLVKRNLICTSQRPRVPQYAQIERVLGQVLHRALRRECSDAAALREAQDAVAALMTESRATAPAG
ncbi:extracellular solute-binding protein [Lichenifustis flavocetrariae]|uniref:Extracellular solute-binding protein n=1 Tax=Lichenifustis flavocetrariae TaxID=2949735 RepID=A0AA41YXV4_9HYPH|nr:extracellular solute-binding protein [Lichenifustis flavocetrariae]MCW6509266.1 extracellular solute-binding protein [Lichenifustis flavocetrariae]